MPIRFNDGSEIPEDLTSDAVEEIVQRFGAVSFEREAVEGQWKSGSQLYRDHLSRIVIDVPDTPSNRKWMKAFKSRWKERLDQLELWMISYRIDLE